MQIGGRGAWEYGKTSKCALGEIETDMMRAGDGKGTTGRQ
nr:MAG TPA: hypothetical protein [Caudoviricetes sp.]